jgi:hypothetical protein
MGTLLEGGDKTEAIIYKTSEKEYHFVEPLSSRETVSGCPSAGPRIARHDRDDGISTVFRTADARDILSVYFTGKT